MTVLKPWIPENEISVLMAYAQKNLETPMLTKPIGLRFKYGSDLHLKSYFVYTSNEGFDPFCCKCDKYQNLIYTCILCEYWLGYSILSCEN